MVATTKEIKQFLGNIFYAKGKRFDDSFLAMWAREINETKASAIDLHNAEKVIIREEVKLEVVDVCGVIKEQINLNKPKLVYKKVNCPYCEGRGWVEGLKFETNGKYTGHTYAISCCCGQKPIPNSVIMREDLSNNHKTEVKDGYYLVFPSIVEKFEYLDKVYANDNWDIRRG